MLSQFHATPQAQLASKLLKLIREHTEHVNVDDLVGEIDMEFEEDEVAPSPAPQRSKGCSIVRKFLHLFSGD